MITNQLGNTDIFISRLAFGCMSLDLNDKQACIKLIRDAADSGINFFDTADLYNKGLNEEVVGNAIQPFRDRVHIATKVGNEWRPDGSGWDWNPSKKYIRSAVEQSLRRLKTDYIDLYQLHGGTIDDPIDEVIETFELLKDQGKIRAYGISSIRPNVIREWVNRSAMSSVMMQYSLLDRRPEESILELLQQNKISVITRGSLAKGLLAGKSAKPYLDHTLEEVKNLQEYLKFKSKDDPEAYALGYVWGQPAVATAAVGIRTSTHLTEALKAEKNQPDPSLFSDLSDIIRPYVYEKHR